MGWRGYPIPHLPDRARSVPVAELSECQAKLQELTGMLQSLEALHRIPSAPLISGSQVSGTAAGTGAEHHPAWQPPPSWGGSGSSCLLLLTALGRCGEAKEGQEDHQDLVHPELRQG